MAAEYGLVVDAACDLPFDDLQGDRVRVLPLKARAGDAEWVDSRDASKMGAIYGEDAAESQGEVEFQVPSVPEICEWLEQEVVTSFDRVLVLSMSAARSPLFEHWERALFHGRSKFRRLRAANARLEDFDIQAVDSGALFTGQAVLACEAFDLIGRSEPPDLPGLVQALTRSRERLHGYFLPANADALTADANGRRGWFGSGRDRKPLLHCHQGVVETLDKTPDFDHALFKLLEIAGEQVKHINGQRSVHCSYAGDPAEIENRVPYVAFCDSAREHDVEVRLTRMNLTAGVTLGRGSFSVAFVG